jgi:hypothetical protein
MLSQKPELRYILKEQLGVEGGAGRGVAHLQRASTCRFQRHVLDKYPEERLRDVISSVIEPTGTPQPEPEPVLVEPELPRQGETFHIGGRVLKTDGMPLPVIVRALSRGDSAKKSCSASPWLDRFRDAASQGAVRSPAPGAKRQSDAGREGGACGKARRRTRVVENPGSGAVVHVFSYHPAPSCPPALLDVIGTAPPHCPEAFPPSSTAQHWADHGSQPEVGDDGRTSDRAVRRESGRGAGDQPQERAAGDDPSRDQGRIISSVRAAYRRAAGTSDLSRVEHATVAAVLEAAVVADAREHGRTHPHNEANRVRRFLATLNGDRAKPPRPRRLSPSPGGLCTSCHVWSPATRAGRGMPSVASPEPPCFTARCTGLRTCQSIGIWFCGGWRRTGFHGTRPLSMYGGMISSAS